MMRAPPPGARRDDGAVLLRPAFATGSGMGVRGTTAGLLLADDGWSPLVGTPGTDDLYGRLTVEPRTVTNGRITGCQYDLLMNRLDCDLAPVVGAA